MRVQLAQLDNARKEFVANASHELRTPLFSIGGFLELLADEDIDEETRRGFIETMQGQVQRLARLSTDLLDLSRVDAGQLTVMLEPVDLGGVVEMLAGEIGHLAVSTGHELRTAIDDDVWCLGDDARILQIGRALATNAMTHTPAGTTVTLRARRRGDRAELSVEDDGPGIPDDPARGRLRAVLSRRGWDGVRQRARSRHRSRDRANHGRRCPARLRGRSRRDSRSTFPAEPIPPGAPRSAQAFSRENAAPAPERVPQG